MKLPKSSRITEVEFVAPTRNPDHAWVRVISGERWELTHDSEGIRYGKYFWPWSAVNRLVLVEG